MRCVLASLLIALGIICCGAGSDSGNPGPDPAPAWAAEAASQRGGYRIAVRPRDASAPRSQLHEWIVRVARSDGGPARLRHVGFDGGMPAHRHGFVTAPRVTRDLGGGEFLVEGVKFHMPGAWELRVSVIDDDGADGAVFPISVAP